MDLVIQCSRVCESIVFEKFKIRFCAMHGRNYQNGCHITKHENKDEAEALSTGSNNLQKFHEGLTNSFYRLGSTIADHPFYFIIIPLIICILGGTGFLRMNFLTDGEKLFYPRDGPALYERSLIEHFFPLNSSAHFMPYYITRRQGFARVLIEPKDKGNIFRKYLWKEILQLDQLIQNISINYDGNHYPYDKLCAKRNKSCIPNLVLNLYDDIKAIERGEMKLNYPLMIIPLVVPMFFGGITLDKSELFIQSARALNLVYFLKTDTEEDMERALIWEREFTYVVDKKIYNNIDIYRSTAVSYKDATTDTPRAVMPLVPIVVVIMVLFSIGNAMMMDWVRSKMFVGLIGLLSAGLAAGGAFGMLMHLGVPNAGINYMSPFLIIGIGLDDMFVMLSAWRRTSIQDDVRKRLGQTYSDSGMSMLITSLTNVVSFLIGATAPALAIRIFCLYTAAAVFMIYIVHMTFFGGFLAVFGYFEKEQRHAVSLTKVKARSEVDAENKCYSLWCAGGINRNDPWNPKDNQPHYFMVLFRDYFGKLLTTYYAKCIIIFSFIIYLIGGIYGILNLSEGYDKPSTVRTDSRLYQYIMKEETLFRQHPYSIQVLITGDISYSNITVQKEILNLHEEFKNLIYIQPELVRSWMPSWFRRVQRSQTAKNFASEELFIKEIRKSYLSSEDNMHYYDIAYNDNYSRIVASRFFLQTREIKDSNVDTKMMNALREVAHQSSLNVTVYNPYFTLFDHGNFVKPAVIQATAIASFSMVIISLILIPNKWCSLYVGFNIVSIELGVIGYMALWNVSLNFISMICLIMCIGFSVDFTAHISYAYCISKAKTPNEKIMDSLYCLGLPILQGGLSTICSIFVFIFAPANVYLYFFKVVFLVVLFAGLHGLFLMPVLLSIAGPDKFETCNRKNKIEPQNSFENSVSQISNNVL